jgi:hypothetical protein
MGHRQFGFPRLRVIAGSTTGIIGPDHTPPKGWGSEILCTHYLWGASVTEYPQYRQSIDRNIDRNKTCTLVGVWWMLLD